jgi:serpin B
MINSGPDHRLFNSRLPTVSGGKSTVEQRERSRRPTLGAVVMVSLMVMLGGLLPANAATAGKPNANQLFARRLWKQFEAANPTGNLVISPYSIAEAFSMLSVGAKGRTATQLNTALVGKGNTVAHEDRGQTRSSIGKESIPSGGTRTRIANSLWVDQGYPLTPSFSSSVTRDYDAKTAEVEFDQSQAAADQINDWIAKATEQQIKDLLPADVLNPFTRAVLVNAIYFQGKWSRQFSAGMPADFKVSAKRSVPVDMMRGGQGSVLFSKSAIEIQVSYTSDVVMRLRMPRTVSRASLQSAMVSLIGPPPRRGVCPNLQVSMPKWDVRTTTDLVSLMPKLGVNDVFDASQSDLSGISPTAELERLVISKALHEATITVDEEGTTAAAATALITEALSGPAFVETCPTSVTVDRPFVYVLQHVGTGEVLFAGRVTDPSQ